MAFNSIFHFFFNRFSCNSDEPLSQKSKRQPKKQMSKKKKMKYMDKTLSKMERNRLCMEIYHHKRCSEKQKQKIREYDRKRAAATRLKMKIKQESNREKFVKKVCTIAKYSPRKMKIIADTMATHNTCVIISKPTLSILQLQSL